MNSQERQAAQLAALQELRETVPVYQVNINQLTVEVVTGYETIPGQPRFNIKARQKPITALAYTSAAAAGRAQGIPGVTVNRWIVRGRLKLHGRAEFPSGTRGDCILVEDVRRLIRRRPVKNKGNSAAMPA